MTALREAAPGLAPLDALARVADAASLVYLAGGAHEATVLAWNIAVEPLRDHAALAARVARLPRGGRAPIADGGWSLPAIGDLAIQLDHEFPAAPGRAWRLDRFVAWDAAGAATLHARDIAELNALRAGLARAPLPLPAPRLAGALRGAWDADGHRERVERMRALIAAGEIYQANLTLPFSAPLVAQPQVDAALAVALIGASPAPYAAFLRGGGGPALISHSPERFLRIAGEAVESAPIKGTRRREPGRDDAARAELAASPKERAELAMIVDLVRNDLGRVCAPGSVAVAEPAGALDLPYVHHLLARVRGRLRADQDVAAAIRAAFPAGSITGCPKLRAMQVIAALESGPRGAYCGAFGWLGGDAADLAVAIRTMSVADGVVRLQVGGGITADSRALDEWDEALAKAQAMAAALGARV